MSDSERFADLAPGDYAGFLDRLTDAPVEADDDEPEDDDLEEPDDDGDADDDDSDDDDESDEDDESDDGDDETEDDADDADPPRRKEKDADAEPDPIATELAETRKALQAIQEREARRETEALEAQAAREQAEAQETVARLQKRWAEMDPKDAAVEQAKVYAALLQQANAEKLQRDRIDAQKSEIDVRTKQHGLLVDALARGDRVVNGEWVTGQAKPLSDDEHELVADAAWDGFVMQSMADRLLTKRLNSTREARRVLREKRERGPANAERNPAVRGTGRRGPAVADPLQAKDIGEFLDRVFDPPKRTRRRR